MPDDLYYRLYWLLDLAPAMLLVVVGLLLAGSSRLFRFPASAYPTCRSCGTDLRPICGREALKCPGCDRRLPGSGVRWMRRRSFIRLPAMAIFCLALGIALGTWTWIAHARGLRFGDLLGGDRRVIERLIATADVRNAQHRWHVDWVLLQSRAARGYLSPDSIQAVERHVLENPRVTRARSVRDQFFGLMAQDCLLRWGFGSNQLLDAVLSWYPEPLEDPLPARRVDPQDRYAGPASRIFLPPMSQRRNPACMIRAVREISIGDRTIAVNRLDLADSYLPVSLDPTTLDALELEFGSGSDPVSVPVSWVEDLGFFSPTVARAIVNDALVDPSLWPSEGFRATRIRASHVKVADLFR